MSSLQSTMLILFGVIIIGYIAGKLGKINEKDNKTLSSLMMNILAPFLIVSSVTDISRSEEVNVFKIMILGIIMYLILIIVARIYVKIIPLNKFEKPVYEVGMVFGNVFFLGYPIFKSLIGEQGIFINTILNMPFNLLLFSYGLYLFIKDSQDIKITLKGLISPALVASIIALAIYIFNINLPNVIKEIVSNVGDMTIPLSMILIGSSLSTVDIKYIFKDYKAIIYSIVKLLILPTIVFFITKNIGLEEYLVKMITLSVGFPAASMLVMFATQYNKSIRSATISVFISTILSLITIPLIEKFLFQLL